MRWVNLHNWSKLLLQIHIGSNSGRAICAAEHSDSEGDDDDDGDDDGDDDDGDDDDDDDKIKFFV